jgi:hypothetical protein
MLTQAQAVPIHRHEKHSEKMNRVPAVHLSSSHASATGATSSEHGATCSCGGGCSRCEGKLPVQTKLAVSEPGDIFEQEADRVAGQVMRMPAPAIQRACACGGDCPRCSANDHSAREANGVTSGLGRGVASIQTAPANKSSSESSPSHSEVHAANEHESTTVPPSVYDVLESPGHPLDTETRAFMEPRFGYDFSNVRIHDDSPAHGSSKQINALAYTQGEHIVFGPGQYQPQTNAGKELLAHELAHVMQQNKSGNSGRLFRRIEYPDPQFSSTNATDTFLAGGNLALTTPTVNGTALPNNINDAGDIVFKAFKLDANSASIKKVGEDNVCSYDEPVVNISANISLVDKPNNEKWSGQTKGNNLAGRNANCGGKGNIPVEATGDPRATTIYDKMVSNEMEHCKDLKGFSATHLGGLLTFLRSFKDKTAKDAGDCQNKFLAYAEPKDAQMILAFMKAVAAKVAQRDVRPGPHFFNPQVHIAQDCSRIDIIVKPSK